MCVCIGSSLQGWGGQWGRAPLLWCSCPVPLSLLGIRYRRLCGWRDRMSAGATPETHTCRSVTHTWFSCTKVTSRPHHWRLTLTVLSRLKPPSSHRLYPVVFVIKSAAVKHFFCSDPHSVCNCRITVFLLLYYPEPTNKLVCWKNVRVVLHSASSVVKSATSVL